MMLMARGSPVSVLLRQSIAVTMHWEPKMSKDFFMKEGSLTAVVFTVNCPRLP